MSTQELNKKLFEKMESKKMILNETDLSGPIPLQKGMSDKQDVGKMINNALIDKVNKEADKKKSYVILSEILPYSDRRELKVKFKLADIIK